MKYTLKSLSSHEKKEILNAVAEIVAFGFNVCFICIYLSNYSLLSRSEYRALSQK